jgi:hypothetical protein
VTRLLPLWQELLVTFLAGLITGALAYRREKLEARRKLHEDINGIGRKLGDGFGRLDERLKSLEQRIDRLERGDDTARGRRTR